MKILTETETAALVDEGPALDAARQAFLAAATGVTFPIVIGHGGVEGSRFSLKSGSSGDLVGVKIGSYWQRNEARGIPCHSSAIVLLDRDTGRIAQVHKTSSSTSQWSTATCRGSATWCRATSVRLTGSWRMSPT